MSIQRDLHCRKKEEWSRHAERSKDREHMAPGEKKEVTVVHFSWMSSMEAQLYFIFSPWSLVRLLVQQQGNGLFTINLDNGILDKHRKKLVFKNVLSHGNMFMNIGKKQDKKLYMHNNTFCLFKCTDKKQCTGKIIEENKPNSKQWLVLEAGNTADFCVLQIYSSKLIIRLTPQKPSEVIVAKCKYFNSAARRCCVVI